MSALLAFRDVTCLRGGRILFEGLGFAIEPGGAALVTGPNGAGKSSLVRLAAGLLAPHSGEIDRAEAALLAEQAALDPELPLMRALDFWAGLEGQRGNVRGALVAVGLDALAEVPVRLLSTGQRRRAALARVVASAAPLWLLDEPASGLDAKSLAMLERLIAAHRLTDGAVLVATHQPIALPGAQEIAL